MRLSQFITRPGSPYPLGATYDGAGTNFAVFSEVATKVELCLFDQKNKEYRLEMTQKDNFVWHIYVGGVDDGTLYGYRIYGPDDCENGNRCNPNKLLIDPYARAIKGMVDGDESLYSYYFDEAKKDEINTLDSKDHTMKSVVVSPFFDWGNDRPPLHAYENTIIYEAHVRGMTMLNERVPKNIRGTYLGLCHDSVIKHLKQLGVTAIELMPIHQYINDPNLVQKGLNNYWGYNTIGFFSPHNAYSAYGDSGEQVKEFKTMVKTFHQHGIEVILDVVYNHTAEGNHLGPTLSFKGLDNKAYYRLVDGEEQHYFDTTGTGNSLLMRSPQTLQLITDSLRYWVEEMHVDGFRFDLAATLARQFHEVDKLSAFFDVVHQDPVISRVKLIAEPWDLGDGGYQVGGFPVLWSEWNGHYRDVVRDYWRSVDSTLAQFATRITGSSDIYEHTGRKSVASVNFITAHDGFTLNDLVCYNDKHNAENAEDNMDGENHNRSWNCGVEGETDNPDILKLREKQKRNFLATLMLSQGVPMLLHGDEIGRSQRGNNNGYCQDNEITWVNWETNPKQRELLQFTARLINFRKRHPVFHRKNFPTSSNEIMWFDIDGNEMQRENWDSFFAKTMMLFLDGSKLTDVDYYGDKLTDESFLVIFNAHYEQVEFKLPMNVGSIFRVVLDTSVADGFVEDRRGPVSAGASIKVEDRSLVVLRIDRNAGQE